MKSEINTAKDIMFEKYDIDGFTKSLSKKHEAGENVTSLINKHRDIIHRSLKQYYEVLKKRIYSYVKDWACDYEIINCSSIGTDYKFQIHFGIKVTVADKIFMSFFHYDEFKEWQISFSEPIKQINTKRNDPHSSFIHLTYLLMRGLLYDDSFWEHPDGYLNLAEWVENGEYLVDFDKELYSFAILNDLE